MQRRGKHRRGWLFGTAVLLFALVPTTRGIQAEPDPGLHLDRELATLIEADRIPEAVALLRRHLATEATDREAWIELGELERRRCNLSGARRVYDRLLVKNLLDPAGHAGHAELSLLEADPQEALESAALALATPEGRAYGPAWRAKAMALVDLGRYRPALIAARKGVALAPEDPLVVEAYARAAFRAGDMRTAREAYTRATALDPVTEEANMRLGSGFGPALATRPWTRDRYAKAFDAGIEAWDRGRLREASTIFRDLVRREPGVYKFRLGLGLVRRAVRREHELVYGSGTDGAYFLLPHRDVPELSTYILNWKDLPDWAREVIEISVAPAHKWMGELIRYRGTHEILMLDDSLHDAPTRRNLTTMRTFDGRLYAHLRGVGGEAAATGIEKLRGAAEFAFNTFAHEFAHQLLRQAFSRELRKRVEALYVKARNEGRCLDYYAAANVDEYFAQGYEALVSLRKRGCLRDTARHTRAELIERDPALFALLIEVLDLSHETPAAMRSFERATPGR
ncbi:MAG: tetratricopeptide repeat protein [Planctomycetota bacterium]|nr:tetratricopeptide repeat protein [Planctomycetota bacterium]